MPEGPEVKRVGTHLQIFNDWTLVRVTRHTTFNVTNLERLTKPHLLKGVRVYAKWLILDIEEYVILVHLVTEGRFLFAPVAGIHLTLEFTKDDQTKYLYYADKRTISKFMILTRREAVQEIHHWGPDVMQFSYSGEFWQKRFKNSRRKIHAALLDQELMAGIGNYLAAEILYACRISPLRLVKDVTPEEWEQIAAISYKILNDSYAAGGHTSDSFISPDGSLGMYQVCVYNRNLCPLGHVVTKVKVNGRTAHWVPTLQH